MLLNTLKNEKLKKPKKTHLRQGFLGWFLNANPE